MKKYLKSAILAAMAIAVTGFTSCNKGDVPPPGEVRPAVLNITVTNPEHTRSSGAAPSGNTITDVTIFVLNESGIAEWKIYVPNLSTYTNNIVPIPVTTAAKAVYAIANAGEDLRSRFNNRTQLESAAAQTELPSQYTALVATGSFDGSSGATAWTFQEADTDGNGFMEQSVNLVLKFIAARITVTVTNGMKNYNGAAGTVRLTDVAVLNARNESRFFPTSGSTSLIPNAPSAAGKKYLQGLDTPAAPDTAFKYFPAAADYTVEADGTNQLNSPYSATSYFYVFESDANTLATYPTIVTLVGLDVDDKPVYFPVHLAAHETWATNPQSYAGGVERGKSYNIAITLNGDATVGAGGGVYDPTQNVQNVELLATLSIADWIPVTLGKNF